MESELTKGIESSIKKMERKFRRLLEKSKAIEIVIMR